MKRFIALSVFVASTMTMAAPTKSQEFEIGSVEVTETTYFAAQSMKSMSLNGNEDPEGTTRPKTPIDLDRVGKIISLGKDIVALGETVYELVKKGRPTNTTNYAAISVVPKDPTTKEFVSPFDLEGFSIPVQRSFSASVKNLSGKQVVKFDYQVVYSHSGSFDGRGKYLTGVMIVPKHIETAWGWDFNATMKLDAIMNHGSKTDPVAGALVTIKYQISGWSKSVERNDSIHLSGRGEVQSFGIK